MIDVELVLAAINGALKKAFPKVGLPSRDKLDAAPRPCIYLEPVEIKTGYLSGLMRRHSLTLRLFCFAPQKSSGYEWLIKQQAILDALFLRPLVVAEGFVLSVVDDVDYNIDLEMMCLVADFNLFMAQDLPSADSALPVMEDLELHT